MSTTQTEKPTHTALIARLRDEADRTTTPQWTHWKSLLRAAALAIEELTQERYALRAERDLAQEKLAGCFLSHRRAEARVVELERLLTLIELAAPTAIPGIAPHGIITAGTLLKVRALLASPDTTCKRCERSITDEDYEHGPGLCSAPDTTTAEEVK